MTKNLKLVIVVIAFFCLGLFNSNILIFKVLTAFGYGSSGGTSSPPANVTTVNAPLTISSSQGGTVTQSFSDNSNVTVVIPEGTVSTTTTFSVSQGTLTADNTPAVTTGAFMVGNSIFNITATDINQTAVTNFGSSLSISITVSNLPADTSNLGVYYYNEATKAWILIPGANFNVSSGQVTFTVNHLTKFAIFKTSGTPSEISTVAVTTPEPLPETPPVITPPVTITPQVLGAQEYADGTLLRGPDLRIYVLVSGQKKYIASLSELQKYAGKVIYNVTAEVLNQYPTATVAAAPLAPIADALSIYKNNDLLRSETSYKIFRIFDSFKYYIPNTFELMKYVGHKIYNVADSILSRYTTYEAQAVTITQYTQIKNGDLIRGSDMKIYVVVNGAKQYISSLDTLRTQYFGKPILKVSDEVINHF